MDIALLKKYLKIDADVTDMDEVLAGYLAAAETYVANAGCTIDYNNKLCEVIIVTLVTRFYDSPDLLTEKMVNEVGITINGLITQLRAMQN
jgi:uncharacterized phage protein (predicted DNA packaging)